MQGSLRVFRRRNQGLGGFGRGFEGVGEGEVSGHASSSTGFCIT